MSSLGKTFDENLRQKVVSNDLMEVTRNKYRLILVKVLHICTFFKSLLHQKRSPCNFQNFSKFLENFLPGSEYGAFRLSALNVMFTGCFHFSIFKAKHSGLRQFLATDSPLKMMKNAFYFTLKSFFFCFQDI